MRIFVSPRMLDGFVPVYDHTPPPKIAAGRRYMLLFETGRTTMKVFKQLYLDNKDAYFCVKNMEHLVKQLGPFRNTGIEVVQECGHSAAEASARRRKYADVETRIRGGCRADARGIEISFTPRMLDSVGTCLREPAVYRSAPSACHVLFGHLGSGPRTYAELEKAMGGEALDATLKSMIFAGIVRQRDGCFCINDALHG